MTQVGSGFTFLDYFIVVTCLLLLVFSGALISRQQCLRSSGVVVFVTCALRMPLIPVTLSLVVTCLTPPLLIGVAAEVWSHGIQLPLFVFGFFAACLLVAGFFLPVLVRLKVNSVHEYIILRFSSQSLSFFISCLQIALQVISMSASLYAACVGLHDVARFPVWLSMPVISLISISYVLPCGLPAVIKVNTFNFTVIFIAIISMVSVGLWKAGLQFGALWSQLSSFNRSETFVLDPSPSTRASFWSVNLIFPFYWMALMTSSPVVQHLLSMQSLAKSRMSLVTSGMLLFVLTSCSILLGVLAFYYNTSKGCNPVHSALVITHEQILAHYVIRILDDPGLSGLYTITILVCAISHCSSSQVNIACCVWEDLFKGRFFHVSERIRSSVSRSAALLSGIVSLSLALPVALILPSFDIFEIFIGVTGCLAGPIFGVLVVGSTLPFVGSFGVFFGAVVGLFLTLPLAIGKLFYPHPFASTLLLNCSSSNVDNFHQPLTTPVTWPHMATFLSYPFIGVASCFVFGSLLSLIPNLRSEVINPECLLPCIQWLRKKYSDTWCGACCVEVDAVDCSAAMRASPMFQDTSHIIHKRLMLDGDKSPATHQRLITVDTETVV